MSDIHDIQLEFLRSGPSHNHLLSPLTPYMALCGADGPVSVHLPFEHAQLLSRLNRLRYEIDGVAISPSQGQTELQELGEAIGRVLGQIPGLVAALRSASADTGRLVNIRLKISAFELGLVPFEATMAPADSSGSGAPLLLRTLTSMTREIRRGEPLKLEWNRAPKILFAFASPPGVPAVPAQAHLTALRRAIDPMIKLKDSAEERIPEVRKVLTVLKDATVRSISKACQAESFTHVHILAHGAPMPGSDDRQFGLVLAREDDANGHEVVEGQRLAMALKSMNTNGLAKQPPTVVSLATCDSGNTNSVLTPGGSIAHELHAQDIPWVIASQFPLWMRASSIAAEILYCGLLAGDDPRWVLHQLRQRLRLEVPETHDWASIVAYAAIAPDLEAQVDAFRSRQTKRRMEVKFDRMDELAGANECDLSKRKGVDATFVDSSLAELRDSIRSDLTEWCSEPVAQRDPKAKAERLGMQAASEKRIAIVYGLRGDARRCDEAYGNSRDFYEAAVKIEPVNHWVMTQFLSMAATPTLAYAEGALKSLAEDYGQWWTVARQLAQWQLPSLDVVSRVWAHSTLAELELLGSVYGGDAFSVDKAQSHIVRHSKQIRALSPADAFPVMSTKRQFRRYVDYWPRDEWKTLAQVALDALG